MITQRKTSGMMFARFLQYSFHVMQIVAFVTTWLNGRSLFFKIIESISIYFVCLIAVRMINRKYVHAFLMVLLLCQIGIIYLISFTHVFFVLKILLVAILCYTLDLRDDVKALSFR